jgi:hypothetical protein
MKNKYHKTNGLQRTSRLYWSLYRNVKILGHHIIKSPELTMCWVSHISDQHQFRCVLRSVNIICPYGEAQVVSVTYGLIMDEYLGEPRHRRWVSKGQIPRHCRNQATSLHIGLDCSTAIPTKKFWTFDRAEQYQSMGEIWQRFQSSPLIKPGWPTVKNHLQLVVNYSKVAGLHTTCSKAFLKDSNPVWLFSEVIWSARCRRKCYRNKQQIETWKGNSVSLHCVHCQFGGMITLPGRDK